MKIPRSVDECTFACFLVRVAIVSRGALALERSQKIGALGVRPARLTSLTVGIFNALNECIDSCEHNMAQSSLNADLAALINVFAR